MPIFLLSNYTYCFRCHLLCLHMVFARFRRETNTKAVGMPTTSIPPNVFGDQLEFFLEASKNARSQRNECRCVRYPLKAHSPPMYRSSSRSFQARAITRVSDQLHPSPPPFTRKRGGYATDAAGKGGGLDW